MSDSEKEKIAMKEEEVMEEEEEEDDEDYEDEESDEESDDDEEEEEPSDISDEEVLMKHKLAAKIVDGKHKCRIENYHHHNCGRDSHSSLSRLRLPCQPRCHQTCAEIVCS
jgi:hypothetical protein